MNPLEIAALVEIAVSLVTKLVSLIESGQAAGPPDPDVDARLKQAELDLQAQLDRLKAARAVA
jgi:hypothetical protein